MKERVRRMEDPKVEIRALTLEELNVCVEWAAKEGWNPGLRDAGCFFPCDPEGFIGGFVDGRLAGSVSAVKYGGDFAFIGFFMVRPEFRSLLLGLRLGKAALERLDGFMTGVDGVEKKVRNYQTHGFKLAHFNARYEGVVESRKERRSSATAPLSQIPFERLLEFDAAHFSARRESFLKRWISTEGHIGLGMENSGKLAGYGVARPCRKGFKIGPLFAESAGIAEELLSSLLAELPPGSPFYLDVPEPNKAAAALAEGRGMKEVFRTARMYKGGEPRLPLERIFGVTSFELG